MYEGIVTTVLPLRTSVQAASLYRSCGGNSSSSSRYFDFEHRDLIGRGVTFINAPLLPHVAPPHISTPRTYLITQV